jgi:hypothetical protein
VKNLAVDNNSVADARGNCDVNDMPVAAPRTVNVFAERRRAGIVFENHRNTEFVLKNFGDGKIVSISQLQRQLYQKFFLLYCTFFISEISTAAVNKFDLRRAVHSFNLNADLPICAQSILPSLW